MPDKTQLFISYCTDGLQMMSPCEIGRKVQAKVFVLSEASKWMTVDMVNITLGVSR